MPRGMSLTVQKGTEFCVEKERDHFTELNHRVWSGGETHHISTSKQLVEIKSCTHTDNLVVFVSEVKIDNEVYMPITEDGLYIKQILIHPKYIFTTTAALDEFQQLGAPVNLPCYLDKKSEFYAPELALAIELHEAIIVGGAKSTLSNREDKVDKWYRETYPDMPDLTQKRLSRLATIIGTK